MHLVNCVQPNLPPFSADGDFSSSSFLKTSSAFLPDGGQPLTEDRAVILLAWAYKGAKPEIFFVKLEDAELFSAFKISTEQPRKRNVAMMSIGITRSNIPMGTMARCEPWVVVVKLYFSLGLTADRNALTEENLPSLGSANLKGSAHGLQRGYETCKS